MEHEIDQHLIETKKKPFVRSKLAFDSGSGTDMHSRYGMGTINYYKCFQKRIDDETAKLKDENLAFLASQLQRMPQ